MSFLKCIYINIYIYIYIKSNIPSNIYYASIGSEILRFARTTSDGSTF